MIIDVRGALPLASVGGVSTWHPSYMDFSFFWEINTLSDLRSIFVSNAAYRHVDNVFPSGDWGPITVRLIIHRLEL